MKFSNGKFYILISRKGHAISDDDSESNEVAGTVAETKDEAIEEATKLLRGDVKLSDLEIVKLAVTVEEDKCDWKLRGVRWEDEVVDSLVKSAGRGDNRARYRRKNRGDREGD